MYLLCDAIYMQFVRNYQIRLFVWGDYEFLCHIYGISGASGEY